MEGPIEKLKKQIEKDVEGKFTTLSKQLNEMIKLLKTQNKILGEINDRDKKRDKRNSE